MEQAGFRASLTVSHFTDSENLPRQARQRQPRKQREGKMGRRGRHGAAQRLFRLLATRASKF